MRTSLLATTSLCVLGLALALPLQGQTAKKSRVKPKAKIDFNRDIRPILSEHCFKCHGPDAKEAKGDLRLSDAKSATKNRAGYRVIHPGNAKDSIILGRVTTKNADIQMPPPAAGVPRLRPDQVELLKLWINSGAQYKTHWAFIPPEQPAVPSVANIKWGSNTIDRFVLSQLESQKLKPEPSADKTTLIRRVHLTLTGLTPSPKQVDDFVKDSSPTAYEKMVDSVLASERYGENQARFWLDAVRYGDTHGLHLDNERSAYPYRDWVVRASNQDMPFNDFAVKQLAGDLLPNSDVESKIASGYIRMNPTTNEGGAIEDEFLVKNTFDRVDTTSTVFMGLTTTCAKCHDHKYDPISQKDYYQMFAFFNSTEDAPFDGNLFAPEPAIKAYTPDQLVTKAKFEKSISQMLAQVSPQEANAWVKDAVISGVAFGAWQVSEAFPAKNFDVAFDEEKEPTNWKELVVKPGVIASVVGREVAYAYARSTIESTVKQTVIMQLGSDDGVKVWLNGKQVHSNKVLRGAAEATDSVKLELNEGKNDIKVKIVNNGGQEGMRVLLGTERDTQVLAAKALLGKPDQQAKVNETYLNIGPENATTKAYRAEVKAFKAFTDPIPLALIAKELAMPRKAYILRRGEYDLKDKEVTRGVPAALGGMPKSAPKNRLGFAQWLTSEKNPLFTRVFVNKIWQQHFGTGIVKSAEDFGNQGDWPSHPELLDYLAIDFAKNGYSVKKLHKSILMSSAFRQSAKITKEKLLKDPENRLISRGPRFRLDAEVLRDQVLNVSGLLVIRNSGRGFRPYMPAGLWEEIGFPSSTSSKYEQDMTDEIYRRSLYLFWKRTSPHPAMLAFDAPMRESCVVRRPRTNTPLQSLVTLNEPAFIEASRCFAELIVKTKEGDSPRLRYAFRRALSREPSEKEIALLLPALQRYRQRFAASPKEATQLTSVGIKPVEKSLKPEEVAAWTLIANTLFNLDEFLTQH